MNKYYLIHFDNNSSKNDLLEYLLSFEGIALVLKEDNFIIISSKNILKNTIFHSIPLLSNDLNTSITVLDAHKISTFTKYVAKTLSKSYKNKLFSLAEGCSILFYEHDIKLKQLLLDDIGTIDYTLALTGKTYITSSFNAIKASQELGIHRNTLDYRLKQIKDYFELDLQNFDDALFFLLILNITGVCA